MGREPTSTDKHVGSRIRMRRLMLGLSQMALAHKLGVSFQQVQKYEKGVNRVAPSRLQPLSDILQVAVSFFFEGIPEVGGTSRMQADPPDLYTDFLATSDGLALTKAFMQIASPRIRRSIVHLVEQIADRTS